MAGSEGPPQTAPALTARVQLRRAAQLDFAGIEHWYEFQRLGLGSEFRGAYPKYSWQNETLPCFLFWQGEAAMRYAIVIEGPRTTILRTCPIYQAVLRLEPRLRRSKRESVRPSTSISMACVRTVTPSLHLRVACNALTLRHSYAVHAAVR